MKTSLSGTLGKWYFPVLHSIVTMRRIPSGLQRPGLCFVVSCKTNRHKPLFLLNLENMKHPSSFAFLLKAFGQMTSPEAQTRLYGFHTQILMRCVEGDFVVVI